MNQTRTEKFLDLTFSSRTVIGQLVCSGLLTLFGAKQGWPEGDEASGLHGSLRLLTREAHILPLQRWLAAQARRGVSVVGGFSTN